MKFALPKSLKAALNALKMVDGDAERGWPGYLFGGHVRTSTVALILAFSAVWWVYDTYHPSPKTSPQVPATQVVPPGFVPDPNYTWVPRSRLQQPAAHGDEGADHDVDHDNAHHDRNHADLADAVDNLVDTHPAAAFRAAAPLRSAAPDDDNGTARAEPGATALKAWPAILRRTVTLASRDDHP